MPWKNWDPKWSNLSRIRFLGVRFRSWQISRKNWQATICSRSMLCRQVKSRSRQVSSLTNVETSKPKQMPKNCNCCLPGSGHGPCSRDFFVTGSERDVGVVTTRPLDIVAQYDVPEKRKSLCAFSIFRHHLLKWHVNNIVTSSSYKPYYWTDSTRNLSENQNSRRYTFILNIRHLLYDSREISKLCHFPNSIYYTL